MFVWPLVLITAILVLRPHLSGLAQRMSQARLSFRDWSFDVGLQGAQERVAAMETIAPVAPDGTAAARTYAEEQLSNTFGGEAAASATISGHTAILDTFSDLIMAIHRAAELIGVAANGNPEAFHPNEMKRLARLGVIDWETEQSIRAIEWTHVRAVEKPDSVSFEAEAAFRRLAKTTATHVLERAYTFAHARGDGNDAGAGN